ncbi:LptF/LptG family permease [Spongiivirga citrea]|uniref:LptF/LptG family permease n=1 Tax=Spongiivirga citrea TaxID=1481457 RepID=A0A6M0CG09_9FLAO|nr:LptF/LptG family permease [Spongiivirga citrea]NER16761.1 LptF/LptG family permease [Spongiivirga citrea]
MKILDRYILFSFIKIFVSTLTLLMFIFVLQSLWLYINELAGKGLGIDIILKFLFFVSPKLVPLVLPLSVLLASIMTFGNFAENYEFAAMKSSGISLQRAMGSLIIFIFFTGIGAFYFSNTVIPKAELKFFNLRRNLAKLQPALAIEEGIFNDIGDKINIKVDDKHGDNDEFLTNITIHEKSPDGTNRIVLRAKTGELKSSKKSDVLQLVLFEGNRYEDVNPKKRRDREKLPHAKVFFEEYTMNIDISDFNDVDLEQQDYKTFYRMLSVVDLKAKRDTLTEEYTKKVELFGDNVLKRTGIVSLSNTTTVTDKEGRTKTKKNDKVIANPQTPNLDSVVQNLKDYKTIMILDQAINNTKNSLDIVKSKEKELFNSDKLINLHITEFHNKFALGVSCIILFFVGAPLGAIIRKGGMGLPMVLAIIIFLAYHFIGIFGNKSAEDGTLNPIIGSWLSTMIMLPFSVILTRKATADKGLFNPDSITMPIKNFFEKIAGIKKKKSQ